MFDLVQPAHLLFVLVVALLIFGPRRLLDLGRSAGQALRSFKTGLSDEETTRKEEISPEKAELPHDAPPQGTGSPVKTPSSVGCP